MISLVEATECLIVAALDEEASEKAFGQAMQTFVDEVGKCDETQLASALERLATVFRNSSSIRAAHVANLCGFYIERGADPKPVAESLLPFVSELLLQVAALCRACDERMPDVIGADEDGFELFEAIKEQFITQNAELQSQWKALEIVYPSVVAVLSKGPQFRAALLARRADLQAIEQWHIAGDWLSRISQILHCEPILVIDPTTKRGIRGTVSGVADNMQLHTLLMEFFPPVDGSLSISPEILSKAKNERPDDKSDVTVIGRWNLLSWRTLAPDGALPEGTKDTSHWIWGEGTPADIPLFNGYRVIVLAPPSYQRSWHGQPIFGYLPAEISVDEVLTEDQITDWIGRMVVQARKSNL